jgi:hypothetical protein
MNSMKLVFACASILAVSGCALESSDDQAGGGQAGVAESAIEYSDPYTPVRMYVTGSWTTETGPGSQYVNAGSVANEWVSVLGSENGWYFIEYDVTGTPYKKRGFVPTKAISRYPGYMPLSWENCQTQTHNRYYVFTHPTLGLFGMSVGWVGPASYDRSEAFTILRRSWVDQYMYIEYSTPNGPKRGYIGYDPALCPGD